MQIRLQKRFTVEPCEPNNAELALSKSQGKSDGAGSSARKGWIEGWETVEIKDVDGDLMRANGGDHELLLSKGYYQYEHPALAHTLIGRPVSATVGVEPNTGKPGVLSRGYFYLSDPMGKVLFEKAQMLAQDEPDDPLRRLGMSLEGKGWDCVPLEVPGGRWDIRKWRPHAIAITHRPKVDRARIPGGEVDEQVYDIACSLLAAEEMGQLDFYLGSLLENRKLVKSLIGGEDVDERLADYVNYAMEQHGLTRSQAMVLVEQTQRLLA